MIILILRYKKDFDDTLYSIKLLFIFLQILAAVVNIKKDRTECAASY